jgi:uncharacterized membrane protein
MKSTVRIHDHPVHPMLVAVPIGLWVFSFVADVLYLIGLDASWRLVSAYCMAGGCAGGLMAALPGFIDYLFIHDSISKRIAIWHMMINCMLI